MKTTGDLTRAIKRGTPETLRSEEFDSLTAADYLKTLARARRLEPKDLIRRCNLDRSYGYQLLNGTRIPTRNTVLLLALELRFTETETQRLLKLCRRPVLYARCRRDAAILYAMVNNLGVEGAEALLAELGEAGLQ